MNRQEHLDRCKQRALQYIDSGDISGALASMISDLGKHDDTRDSVDLCVLGMLETTSEGMKRFINGFN